MVDRHRKAKIMTDVTHTKNALGQLVEVRMAKMPRLYLSATPPRQCPWSVSLLPYLLALGQCPPDPRPRRIRLSLEKRKGKGGEGWG